MKCLFQIARRRRTSRIFTTNVVQKLLTSDTLVIISHDETHLIASEWPKIHLAKVENEQQIQLTYHYDIPVNEDAKTELRVMSYWFQCPGFIVSWWSHQYAFEISIQDREIDDMHFLLSFMWNHCLQMESLTWGMIRERRDVYLTGPTCQKRNLLVLIHPFQWDMQEGGTLYEMVRLYINWCSVARRSHLISTDLRQAVPASQLWRWAVENHDGTWVWLALFCHSIDSWFCRKGYWFSR